MNTPSTPLVDNSGDRQQVRRARKRAAQARRDELADVRAIIATEEGRRFYWRRLESAGVFTQQPAEASEAVLRFSEGRRSMGLRDLADLGEADPQALIEMMQAHNQRQANPRTTNDS